VERAKIAFPQTKERSSMMADLNKGFNMDSYNKFKSRAQENPKVADRDKTAVAYWVQGEEARVVLGDKEVTIGADAGMNMMEMLLSSYAACDAAMVALHASFMDLKVERLKVEVSGHFNVAAYLGIEDAPGAGYDQISVKVYLDAPDATPEQLAYLHHISETGSPVGDTFSRIVPTELEIVAAVPE
jgi:uncharacterized OsmC-like protein